MKKTLILTCILSLGLTASAYSYYYENSTPHNAASQIPTSTEPQVYCEECHAAPDWGQPDGWQEYLQNTRSKTDATQKACFTCHLNKDGYNYLPDNAPYVMNHSSDDVSIKFGVYKLACWECHQNHATTPPTDTPLVSGTVTGITNVPMEWGQAMNITISATKTVNDPAWSNTSSWMQKNAIQYPYSSLADPTDPSYAGGPCDPGPDGLPNTADDNYNEDDIRLLDKCNMGVKPGERGLMMWVQTNSSNWYAFEVVDTSATNQVLVKGRLPAGESLTPSKPFNLRYGMLMKSQIEPFGFCSPDPNFCSEHLTTACTADTDCPDYAVGEVCGISYRCKTNDDCPTGETCAASINPSNPNNDFNVMTPSAAGTAYNENGTGIDPTPTGICQVCHTRTKYWRNDGTLTSHNNGQACVNCHIHTKGFAPSDCNSCHTNPPTATDGIPSMYTGAEDYLGIPPGGGTGAHEFHGKAPGYNFACGYCHADGMPKTPTSLPDKTTGDKKLQIGFDIMPVGGEETFYGEQAVADFAANPSNNFIGYVGTNGTTVYTVGPTDPDYMTCKNIYCHSQGKRLIQGYDLPSTSNPWHSPDSDIQGDGFKCNNCHNYPPGFDSHLKHKNIGFGSCDLCHAVTTPNGVTIGDYTRHVNGKYDVDPGSAFYARKSWHPLNFVYSFADGGGTCSSNSCHQYYNYRDPYAWKNVKQELSAASFTYVQAGTCQPDATTGAVNVDINITCTYCEKPYTCEINWGDGTAVQIVENCDTAAISHTYSDQFTDPVRDPEHTIIGAWDISWTAYDQWGVTLSDDLPELPPGWRAEKVEVCPRPNELPVPSYTYALGPADFDLIITDRSTDNDWNVGTHSGDGMIRIEWGGSCVGSTGACVTQEVRHLENVAIPKTYTQYYKVRAYYTVKHAIKDNASGSSWQWSPNKLIYVTR